MKNEAFEEMELVDGKYRIVWEYIGEGWDGDYNPEDESDTPLLRFSCDEKEGEERSGGWMLCQASDGSDELALPGRF